MMVIGRPVLLVWWCFWGHSSALAFRLPRWRNAVNEQQLHSISKCCTSYHSSKMIGNDPHHHGDTRTTTRRFVSVADRFEAEDDLERPASSSSSIEKQLPLPSAATALLQPQHLPLIQMALAGSLATLVADISTHPIDCIKTVQQSDMAVGWSVLQAAAYLWTTAGPAAFYKGFMTYACSDAVGGALKFSVWEWWKSKTRDWPGPTLMYLWIGAALAFVASSFLIVPGELIKNQMQMGHYDGLWATVQGIYQASGGSIAAFYAGYEAVLYRDVPYTILELGLYEVIKSAITRMQHEELNGHMEEYSAAEGTLSSSPKASKSIFTTSLWQEIGAAAATGAITAFCTAPLDTVKTKLMVESAYQGMTFYEALVSTVHVYGWEAVFAGVLPRVAWIVPSTAVYLPTYDFLKRQLLRRRYPVTSSR